MPATAPAERAAPRSGEHADPLLALLHIPKTAGTTLARVMREHYGEAFSGGAGAKRDLAPDEQTANIFSRPEHVDTRLRSVVSDATVRAFSGHITFGYADLFRPDTRWVTVLRDPVARTLSQYAYLVQPPPRHTGRAGGGLVPPWLPPPGAELTVDEALAERGYIPDNLQTRMLCGILSPYDPLPADALERAKRNLTDRFAYVGTTERFDRLLALLNLELGWPTVAYRRSNVNRNRLQRADLPAAMLEIVEKRNTLDRELHAHAGKLLDGAVSGLGRAFARKESELAEVRLEAKRLRGAKKAGRG